MSEKKTKPKSIRLFKLLILIFVIAAAVHSVYFADTPQIDMRAVVTVLGLDSVDGGRYKASAHVIVPVSEGNTKSSQDIIEAEGGSILEAIDSFNVINGSKVETSQCGMIIFGKTICDNDVLTPVKSLMSSGKISAGVILISADRLEAAEFLKIFGQMSNESSSNLNSFTSFFENSLYMPALPMAGFLNAGVTESNASYLPSIELKETAETGQKGGDDGGSQKGGGGSGEENGGSSSTKIRSLSNIVIFKEGKRIGVLGKDESEGLSWSDMKSKRGFIRLDDFEEFDREYKDICGEVTSKNTRIYYSFKNERPHIKIKVRTKITIIDRHTFNYDLDKSRISEYDQTQMFNRRMSDRIQSEIDSAIQAIKRLNADFMGLKYNFYRLKNKEMRKYEADPYKNFIRDFEVEYDIKCDVR